MGLTGKNGKQKLFSRFDIGASNNILFFVVTVKSVTKLFHPGTNRTSAELVSHK